MNAMRARMRFSTITNFGFATLALSVFPTADASAELSSGTPPPLVQFVDKTGVDLSSGQFVLSGASVTIGLQGAPSLSFAPLQINSNIGNGTPLYAELYENDCLGIPGCLLIRHANLGSRQVHFSDSGNYTNGFRSPTGEVLTFSDGKYLITEPDGTVWSFTSAGKKVSRGYDLGYLAELKRPNGELLTYTFGSIKTIPLNIISNAGFQLHRDATGSVYIFNMASEYCDTAATTCNLSPIWPRSVVGYLPSGRVGNTITDALGRITTMEDLSTSTTMLTSPGGVYTKITRGSVTLPSPANNMIAVTKVETALATWSYAYTGDQHGKLLTATVTGPSGKRSYASSSDSTAVLTDELSRSVNYSFGTQNPNPGLVYHSNKTFLVEVAYPELNKLSWGRDTRANITNSYAIPTQSSGQATIESSASYDTTCANPKTCNRPNYELDGRNNRTDYNYDSNTGLVLTKTLPAGPNGVRPQTRYSYTPLYAKYKNASGVLTAFTTPIYKLTGISTCQTMVGEIAATATSPKVLAACLGTADEVRTTIAYDGATGVNNLLPTSVTVAAGDGSLSATTTTTYDVVGNAISQDGPLPGAADTTRIYYDAVRQMVGVIGPDPDGAEALLYRATKTTYNADGMVTLEETGTATSQSDNAMSSFVPLAFTRHSYDPATGQLIKTEAGQP